MENRREFLKHTLTGAAALGAGAALQGRAKAAAEGGAAQGLDQRVLGRIGKEVPILGLGFGSAFRVPNADDPETMEAMMARALELGAVYWDTARNYGTEHLMGDFVGRHRDDIFLVSKSQTRDYDGFLRDFETSLEELQTDYIDLYHIHSLQPGQDGDMSALEDGCARAARRLKDEGAIGHFGITGHSGAGVLIKAINALDPDAVMTVLTVTREDDGRYEDELLPLARERNMGVIAMKTVRRGRDADELGTELMRYPLSLPGVHVANVGFDAIAHLETNAAMARGFVPMDADRREQFARRAGAAVAGVPAPWERPGYVDGVGVIA